MCRQMGSKEKQYCIGCGLCKSHFGSEKADLILNNKGFYEPYFQLTQDEYGVLRQFCPVDAPIKQYSTRVWGERELVCLGYAADEAVRRRASSGGVLTAICCYLLEQRIVNGVIQIGDGAKPLQKNTQISRDAAAVLQCAGSRYIAVMPLENMVQRLTEHSGEKFAVVGRPCDIRALKAYIEIRRELEPQIVCALSFFCAGTPSVNATRRMIVQMGADEQRVIQVSYRGNGWPGCATVQEEGGRGYTMNYEESWGKILGRDIYLGCRLCYDGMGEEADIACGDAWYLDEEGNVSFNECPGRNMIFARTQNGARILQQAEAAGYIVCEALDEKWIKKMQPFQYVRKAQLRYKLLAMRMVGREIPAIQLSKLRCHGKLLSLKDKARIYLGTLRRILQNKM